MTGDACLVDLLTRIEHRPGIFRPCGVQGLGRRVLQLVGLLILPIAIAGQAAESMGEGRMLMWAGVGILVFMVGWWVQQSGGKGA